MPQGPGLPGIYPTPLRKPDSVIRLFELWPAKSQDAPLEGSLQHHDLQDSPSYEALSYAWGKPEFNHSVKIGEGSLDITENLDTVLRYIRLPSTKRTLWIDAICIDQSNLDERSHQVALMKRIYEQCRTDLAWIGPNPSERATEADLQDGVELMEQITSRDPIKMEEWKARFRKIWFFDSGEDELGEERSKRMDLSFDEGRLLAQLFRDAPIWKRIWVMQELSCAPRVRLVAGHSTLDWKKISEFLGDQPYADAFHRPFGHGSHPIVESLFGTILKIDNQRRMLRDPDPKVPSTLIDVLSRFSFAKSSNPLDKIYGLLGLASDADIEVSYTKSSAQLYAEVTKNIINTTKDLDIICQSPWRPFGHDPNDREGGLPSWTADFSLYHDRYGNIELFGRREIFNAGRKTCEGPSQVSTDGTLSTWGVILGRIGKVHQEGYGADVHDDDSDAGRGDKAKLVRDCMAAYFGGSLFDQPEGKYINSESAITAFWRTLITDRFAYPMRRLSTEEISKTDEILRERRFEVPERVVGGSNRASLFDDLPVARFWEVISMSWTFAMTDNGHYMMIQPPSREGDVVACLDGGKVPVVLRPQSVGPEATYKVVSVAYVHGFMDMEAYETPDKYAEGPIVLI